MRTDRFGQKVVVALAMCTAIVVTFRVRGSPGPGRCRHSSGTIQGSTGAAMVAVTVDLSNAVTGFKRSIHYGYGREVHLPKHPPNGYPPSHCGPGVHGAARRRRAQRVPLDVDVALKLAGTSESVSVVGHAEDLESSATRPHTPTSTRACSRSCRWNRRRG